MAESESELTGTRVLVLDQDERAVTFGVSFAESHLLDAIFAERPSGIVIECRLADVLDMAFDISVFVYEPPRAKPWLPRYDNGRRYRNHSKRRSRGK
jgi:hypothetical protein